MLDKIKEKICKVMSDAIVSVDGPDYRHLEVTIVSDQFLNLKSLSRQRMIYNIFSEELLSGEMHALSLKTFTKEEHANQTSL